MRILYGNDSGGDRRRGRHLRLLASQPPTSSSTVGLPLASRMEGAPCFIRGLEPLSSRSRSFSLQRECRGAESSRGLNLSVIPSHFGRECGLILAPRSSFPIRAGPDRHILRPLSTAHSPPLVSPPPTPARASNSCKLPSSAYCSRAAANGTPLPAFRCPSRHPSPSVTRPCPSRLGPVQRRFVPRIGWTLTPRGTTFQTTRSQAPTVGGYS